MNNQPIYITQEGAEKLRVELEELKGPKRIELAKRLKHAISQGDLSENADYTAAKEDQAFLEGKIQELEAILRNAEIINGPSSNDIVEIGSRVVVTEGDESPEEFVLVGIKEADPKNGKISNESPIGKALLGGKVGETVVAETPGGQMEFTIIEIK